MRVLSFLRKEKGPPGDVLTALERRGARHRLPASSLREEWGEERKTTNQVAPGVRGKEKERGPQLSAAPLSSSFIYREGGGKGI